MAEFNLYIFNTETYKYQVEYTLPSGKMVKVDYKDITKNQFRAQVNSEVTMFAYDIFGNISTIGFNVFEDIVAVVAGVANFNNVDLFWSQRVYRKSNMPRFDWLVFGIPEYNYGIQYTDLNGQVVDLIIDEVPVAVTPLPGTNIFVINLSDQGKITAFAVGQIYNEGLITSIQAVNDKWEAVVTYDQFKTTGIVTPNVTNFP